jgi:hypothetical protein
MDSKNNPKNAKEADELHKRLFYPKPCPCGDHLRSRDLMAEVLDDLNTKYKKEKST